jgi:hypothetical protein
MCRWRSENPPSAARQSSSQTGEAISEALAAIPEIEAQLAISIFTGTAVKSLQREPLPGFQLNRLCRLQTKTLGIAFEFELTR